MKTEGTSKINSVRKTSRANLLSRHGSHMSGFEGNVCVIQANIGPSLVTEQNVCQTNVELDGRKRQRRNGDNFRQAQGDQRGRRGQS